MARPRSVVRIFPRQFEALRSETFELLVGTARPGDPVGASWLLRNAALRSCMAQVGAQVLLVQKNDADLRRTHIYGETGLVALMREMQAKKFVEIGADEARFGNGSVLRWLPCSREAEISKLLDQRADAVFVDRVEEITEPIYLRLRDMVAAAPAGRGRRIMATTRHAAEGWVARHWPPEVNNGRRFFPLDSRELDPELVVRPSFVPYRQWIDNLHGAAWTWAPHTELVVSAASRWMEDEFEHLAVFMPSQHGKTESIPRNAPGYLLHRYPADWCAIASYQTEIANSRSADAKENYLKAGGQLKPGRRKVREWQTLAGGGCWSAGTAAGQTGRSATWEFLDDGDKDWEDAVNAGKQKKKRRWYGSVFRSRESMFAAEARRVKLCITATRWDPTDINGYALQLGHEAGERWGILVLSAVYDPAILDGYRQMYPNFTILDDFRTEPGTPIWEARRNRKDWLQVAILRGPLIFECESQQNPRGVEKGGVFDSSWFRRLDRDPAFIGKAANEEVYSRTVRAWDLAATEGGGDYTAGVKIGRPTDGGVIVRHAVRAQLSPKGVKQLIAAVMILDGPGVTIRLPIDPAAGGEAQADEIVRYLREVALRVGMPLPKIVCERPARVSSATASAKKVRARPLASIAEPPAKDIPGAVSYVGASWAPVLSNVIKDFDKVLSQWPELRELADKASLVGGDWWTVWLQEMESFTGDDGRTDDEVDATVDAYDETTAAPPRVSGAMARPPGR